MTRRVRYTPPMPPLYPVWDADSGIYLAALLSAEAREAYVRAWGWEVVHA